jgi:hypothetical protein
VIRIRKMPPTETPEFPRRWVASRDPDDDGVARPVLGYFSSQQEAIEQVEFPARIVVMS